MVGQCLGQPGMPLEQAAHLGRVPHERDHDPRKSKCAQAAELRESLSVQVMGLQVESACLAKRSRTESGYWTLLPEPQPFHDRLFPEVRRHLGVLWAVAR